MVEIIRLNQEESTTLGTHSYFPAVAIPVLACLAIAISIPALILHSKNRNYPVTCVVCWFILINIFATVNALIWNTHDSKKWWTGEGLCDIEIRFTAASYVGVPGALVCLFRSLAAVLDTSCATLVPSRARRWRKRLIEVLFCVAIPIIIMFTSFLVQPNRYAIYEVSGCVSVFDQSWPSIILFYMWPGIICLVAVYYCCLVLVRLYKYRTQFSDILKSSDSSLTKSRFLRLFFLSFLILLAIISFQTYLLYDNVKALLPRWHGYSWSKVHGPDWNSILMITTRGGSFLDRWVPIAGCVIVFLFSGLGKDATSMYRSALSWIGLSRCLACLSRRRKGISPLTSSSRGSQARLIYDTKWSSMSRTYVNNSIITTSPFDPRCHEYEHGFLHLPHQTEIQKDTPSSLPRATWNFLRRPFSSGHKRPASITYQSAPLTTVSANAWADRSRHSGCLDGSDTASSPAREGFIQVKQIISQKSESMSFKV